MELRTDRLRIRPLAADDAPALQAITNDRAITDAIDFLRHPFTLDDAKALIAANAAPGNLFHGIWRHADELLIGLVGLHEHESSETEIGYWIGALFWRRGYAREATGAVLAELRARRSDIVVIAECRAENLVSWHILESLGFRSTGRAGARPGRLRLRYSG